MSDTPRTDALIAEFAEGGIVLRERLRAMNIRLVDLARELEAGSARVVARHGWISVTDRLPAEDSFVLAFAPCTNAEPVNTARYMAPGRFKDGWITVMDHPVTHWMPLPNPPGSYPEIPDNSIAANEKPGTESNVAEHTGVEEARDCLVAISREAVEMVAADWRPAADRINGLAGEALRAIAGCRVDANVVAYPDAAMEACRLLVSWEDNTCKDSLVTTHNAAVTAARRALDNAPVIQGQPFQARVAPWMQACFGAEIASDVTERNHRFIEESLELVQASGATVGEAHQLVDYVFGRPTGAIPQEVGGVMVTLAALCLARGIDMHECGETELARVWTCVEKIRAKQAAKPKHSPLPEHVEPPKMDEQPFEKRWGVLRSHMVQIADETTDDHARGLAEYALVLDNATPDNAPKEHQQ